MLAGLSEDKIAEALAAAGWPQTAIKETMARYHFQPSFPLAVPRPGTFSSPRISVLNVFSFALLYTIIHASVSILFTILDRYLPDGLGQYGRGYYYSTDLAAAIRDQFAILIVALPSFFGIERARQKNAKRLRQAMPRLRLWLINLTSLLGWSVLFCMACGTVYYFLDGELGVRFLLKLAILAMIVLGSNLYYRLEVRKAEESA
ncbi:MAG: hypothetical protein IPI58_07080 [Alphaproteobacteria bacterium]|nr:MAG: hypothetical protein IPI58_07080 [Alphaproteobacteria bacterium]